MVFIDHQRCDQIGLFCFAICSLKRELILGFQDNLSAKECRALIETEKIGIMMTRQDRAILGCVTSLSSHLPLGFRVDQISPDDRIYPQAIVRFKVVLREFHGDIPFDIVIYQVIDVPSRFRSSKCYRSSASRKP